MLTWWLHGHDPGITNKLPKVMAETTVVRDTPNSNNTDTTTTELMKELTATQLSDFRSGHLGKERTSNSKIRQTKNGNVTIETEFYDSKSMIDEKSDHDYLFTPVELPGQVT